MQIVPTLPDSRLPLLSLLASHTLLMLVRTAIRRITAADTSARRQYCQSRLKIVISIALFFLLIYRACCWLRQQRTSDSVWEFRSDCRIESDESIRFKIILANRNALVQTAEATKQLNCAFDHRRWLRRQGDSEGASNVTSRWWFAHWAATTATQFLAVNLNRLHIEPKERLRHTTTLHDKQFCGIMMVKTDSAIKFTCKSIKIWKANIYRVK